MRMLAVALAAALVPGASQSGVVDGDALAARVGETVVAYLSQARTILTREEVLLQPLTPALAETGRARRFTYEARVHWEPDDDGLARRAIVHRELLAVDGREPRGSDADGCLPPETDDPLAFLLPSQRGHYAFRAEERSSGGAVRLLVLEYEPRSPGIPSLEWRGDCGNIRLPGYVGGRLFIEPDGLSVTRLEQHLTDAVRVLVPAQDRRSGWDDSIVVMRRDVSIRYGPVRFEEPDEVVTLPLEIQRMTVVRTPEIRALRLVQRYSQHRRFVTGSRVLPAR